MTWLEIVLFGFIIFYIVYLNRKLNYLGKQRIIGSVILQSLKEVVEDENQKSNQES